jgi:hypothetical protein
MNNSPPGLNPTKKNPEKSSELWQNFQTSENSTDFSTCIFIRNSEEKSAEILPANSTKKLVSKIFWFSGKNCGFKIFWICQKIFENSDFFLIGLSPGVWLKPSSA